MKFKDFKDFSEDMNTDQIFEAWRSIINAVEIVQVAILNRLNDDELAYDEEAGETPKIECVRLQELNGKLQSTLDTAKAPRPLFAPSVIDSLRENWREIYDGIYALEEDTLNALNQKRVKNGGHEAYLRSLARVSSRIIRVIEEEEGEY